MTTVVLGSGLTVADVVAVARQGASVALDGPARRRVEAARATIEAAAASGRAVYGVNTGFGDLAQVRIDDRDQLPLQRNLLRSHAVGVGEPLADEIVRAMTLLLAASLARGHSGVRPAVIDLLVNLLNAEVTPVIPSQGSVGASGDLAPLAHLGLALCGEGEVRLGERVRAASDALRSLGLEPIEPASKEGLALINGTHLMAGLGALVVHDAARLQDVAEVAAALSLDVLLGSAGPLDPRIQQVRNRPAQADVAAKVTALMEGSELLRSHADCGRVQDAYTLRCLPQVLGATREALAYVEAAVTPELGAVTDNPLVFPADGAVLSGGNFHGQPLSLPLDVAALAVAELAGFSERRSFRLLADAPGLPRFLTRAPGTQSGLMILQYVAAALVAENSVLAHPAGTASLPTSANQEDFNSMGATAALKARRVVDNATRVVAIELLCAAQALDLRRPLRSTPPLEQLHDALRALSPTVDDDRSLSADIEAVAAAIRDGRLGLGPTP